MSGISSKIGNVIIETVRPEEDCWQPALNTCAQADYQWKMPCKFNPQAEPLATLRCYFGPDGIRRFVLRGTIAGRIETAFRIGISVKQMERLHDEEAEDYLDQFLIYRKTLQLQEYNKQKFDCIKSLCVCQKLERLLDRSDLLPHLFVRTAGTARNAKIEDLLTYGEQYAREKGLAQPTTKNRIEYGLMAFASITPLKLESHQIHAHFLSGMFDDWNHTQLDDLSFDLIKSVIRSVVAKLRRKGAAAVDKQMFSANSNFFTTVMRRLPIGDRAYTTHDVRRVFLAIGREAYLAVADCINTFGETFLRCTGDSFQACELNRFRESYCYSPRLGKLPLILSGRFLNLLPPLLPELWTYDDHQTRNGELYRLVDYYRQMIHLRHLIDRDRKRLGNRSISTTSFSNR